MRINATTLRLSRSHAWACAAAVASLGAWWIAASSPALLREQLRVSQFWFLEALFVVMGLRRGRMLAERSQ